MSVSIWGIDLSKSRNNPVRLTTSKGEVLDIELTDYNHSPEQLMNLAMQAHIEYAAAMAKCKMLDECRFQDLIPLKPEELNLEMSRAADERARKLRWT